MTQDPFLEYNACVRNHLSDFFRGHEIEFTVWSRGPILDVSPNFEVAVISPGPRVGLWGYCSVASAPTATHDGSRLEFILLSEGRVERNVEILAMVSHYHATIGLDVGHTLAIGQDWQAGSSLDSILVSLPYPLGPEFGKCQCQRSNVRLLWLLPITSRERQYKKDNGVEALESKFDEVHLDYWNSQRASVV